MSIDVNKPSSYGAGIAFRDSQRDSLYAEGNQLNEQTPQGAQTAILGEPKLGQTALVVAKRGIIGTPKLGAQETHPSGSTAASPAKPQVIKSFAQLQPKIEQLIKDYENRIDHKVLRSKIHSLLALPEFRHTNILLNYSDAKGRPYRYGELNRVIYDHLAKILKALENSPSQEIEIVRDAEWCKQFLARKAAVRFTESLVDTQKLLRGIERLRSKFTKPSEIKDRLGDIHAGVTTIIEWLTADSEGRNRMLQMPEAHRRGLNFFQSLTSKDVMYISSNFVSQLPEGMAATRVFPNGYADINISSNHLQPYSSDFEGSLIAHELAHLLEHLSPAIREKSIAFASQIKLLAKDSGHKDLFYRNSQGEVTGTEVLSIAVERMYHDPVEFFKDYPNWFGFVIDTLRGLDLSKPDVSK